MINIDAVLFNGKVISLKSKKSLLLCTEKKESVIPKNFFAAKKNLLLAKVVEPNDPLYADIS